MRHGFVAALLVLGCGFGLVDAWPKYLRIFGTTAIVLQGDLTPLPDLKTAYSVDLNRFPELAPLADDVRPSRVPGIALYENRHALLRCGSHEELRAGTGLVSHWGDYLLFTPSAGQSPGAARYVIKYPSALRIEWVRAVLQTRVLLFAAAGLVVCAVCLERRRLLDLLTRLGECKWKRPLTVAATTAFLACLALEASQPLLLARLGRSTTPLQGQLQPRAEIGHAFTVNVSAMPWLGPLADDKRMAILPKVEILEDGVPLPLCNSHDRIRTTPGWASHWGEQLVFSPSPGRDPATSRYEMSAPAAFDCKWVRTLFATQWPMWAAAGIALALCVPGLISPRGSRWLIAATIAAGVFSGVTGIVDKDEVRCTPDSKSYVMNSLRPPLYPWMIQLVTGGELSNHHCDDDGFVHPASLAIGIVWTQVAVFLLGWAVFVAGLCSVAGRANVLAAVFGFALLQTGWLEPERHLSLMSETMTLGLLMAAFGCAALSIGRNQIWWSVAAAFFFGASVATRLAAAYGVIVLLAVAVVFLWQNRRELGRLAMPAAASLFIAMAFLAMCLINTRLRAGYVALNPLRNYERIAWTLEFGQPEDAEFIEDVDARAIFEQSLQRRAAALSAGRKPSTDPLMTFEYNFNVWSIAHPVADARFLLLVKQGKIPPIPDKLHPAAHVPFVSFEDRVFGQIADAVLPRHRAEYWSTVGRSLVSALTVGTSVQISGAPYWIFLAIGLVCCALGRGQAGLLGAAFLGAHLFAVFGTCMMELPLRRYLIFADWTALAGLFCAAIAGASWLTRLRKVQQI